MDLSLSEVKLSEAANLGDKRLNKRLEKLCTDLSKNSSSSIPTLSKNKHQAKGAYRFFSNKKVNYKKIIEAHRKTLLPLLTQNAQGNTCHRILQLDDTTELDYTSKRGSGNLGVLNYEKRKGLYLHNSLLVSDKGVPFGLFKQTLWSRSLDYLGKSAERRSLPLKEKESYRWFDHFKSAEKLCTSIPDLEWVYVADREADFMELLAARNCERMHYVIRSQYNRNLASEENKLWDKLAQESVIDTYEINIIHPTTKKARTAHLEVRFCDATLALTNKHPSGYKVKPAKVNAIEVREINPPTDIKEPIRWVLLTTLPVKDALQARLVIQYYVYRWIIERFFYLLKSGGANLEDLQLGNEHRLKNAISTYCIAMIDAMKLKYLAENQPDMTIDKLGITEQEHEVLYTVVNQYYPKKIIYKSDETPTVREFCVVLGMLSGFYPSKRQPLPGLKILNRAMDKFHLINEIFSITNMSKN